MTLVRIRSLERLLGSPGPADGVVEVTYRDSRGPVVTVDGADVTFPTRIVVRVTGGEPVEPLELQPTDGRCYARVTVSATRTSTTLTRSVAIPDVPAVDFEDLVDVDEDTYQPSESAVAAWEAAIAQVQALTVSAEGAAGEAAGSASAASTAAGEAVAAQGGAVAARAGAETARAGAETAAAGAVAAAGAAETARQGAVTAAEQAQAAVVDSTEFVREQIAQPGPVRDEVIQVVEATVPPIPPGVVTSAQVSRMILTDDPDFVAPDGSLVLLYQQPPEYQFFTGFEDGLAGLSQPWVESAGWSANADDPTSDDGHTISHSGGTGAARRLRMIDAVDPLVDGEAYDKVRVAAVGTGATAVLMVRASGTLGAEVGVGLGLIRPSGSTSRLALYYYPAGPSVAGPFVTFDVPADTWVHRRIRFVGSTVQARAWLDGAPEPDGWMITDTSAPILTPGRVGMMALQAQAMTWDCVGVGEVSAPTGPVS